VTSAGRGVRTFRYELPGGWAVLAGRTDADNDRLSLKVARPDDRWFHVRGMPGSHVILQGPPGAEPGRDTLRAAAAVAAWHSRAREGGVVAVSCTEARHVRKPRGAKPGTVEIRHEVVLKVRPALPATAGDDPGRPPPGGSTPHTRGRETGGHVRP
jgi:predicted ribosome quality control (RQC) complex YloA/Tae2 family protein